MSEMLDSMAQWNWFGILFVVLVVPATCAALHGIRMWSFRPTRAERAEMDARERELEKAWAEFEEARENWRIAHGRKVPVPVRAAHSGGLLEFRPAEPSKSQARELSVTEYLVRKGPRRQG